ncbi:hypothetical protein ANACOL_03074 [Anaerotruncus colihominis DSM 17241]|uniref:Uncharacterized protein n=1 Tax=Anaerotruncus colihominis DSM 17241 TaxID=445972 RepID=B0PDC0_9FIRM|nr:hypothetical protein ANACOL_03074 [Anaerotruncus colihominis DSM 17241]
MLIIYHAHIGLSIGIREKYKQNHACIFGYNMKTGRLTDGNL